MPDPESARTRALDALARWIIAIDQPHPLRVAIDGRTAAGKTTLADELVAPLERHHRPVIRIQIDDFHHPAAVRHRRQELPPWQRYYRDSYNPPAIRDTFLALGAGGGRCYCRALFDSYHDVPISEPERVASPDAIVLVDGVFLFRPELDDLWDVRLFVEIDADESLRRGPPRDQAWVGSVEAAAQRYRTTYIPAEDYYIETVRPCERADVVVDNRDPAVPALWFRHPSGSAEEEP